MNTLIKIAVVVALLLPGVKCAHSSELVLEESAWQLTHAVDAAQTASFASDPCHVIQFTQSANGYWHKVEHCNSEDMNPLIGDGWLIGHNPSVRSVVAVMAAESVLHLAISYSLRSHRTAERIWQAVTISCNVATVARNASLGVKIHF